MTRGGTTNDETKEEAVEDMFFAMVPITFFLTIGGVLIFRPLTKRLGLMLEAQAAGKRDTEAERVQYEHVRALLAAQNLKIEALEQRLEFTESMLENRVTGRFVGRELGPGRTQSGGLA